ncbi:MAG: site-specific tyrosine recombinase XerD [Candidatus Nanopelagicales bacterium]|nr:site-specific tyrosine recombinase XerD [Candidatus Nanopelagicales bacterium]
MPGYLDHVRIERGLSTNTVAAYQRDLARNSAWCAAHDLIDIEQVTPNAVSDFAASLASDLSASSAARVVVSVRGFHKFAIAENWVSSDPAADVKPPGIPRRLPKALSYDSILAIIDSAGQSEYPARDTAIIELLYGTGVRISELVTTDLDDIDRETGTLVVTGKGNKTRLVPVGSMALEAVSRYIHDERPALMAKNTNSLMHRIFLNSRGKPLSRQSAWEIISRTASVAGLTGVTPHSFRHSYATHLLERGADVRSVQELLGHASVTTTQIYTMVTVDTLREIYADAHPRAK